MRSDILSLLFEFLGEFPAGKYLLLMPASHKVSNPQGIHVGTKLACPWTITASTVKQKLCGVGHSCFLFLGGALAHALHTPPRLSNRVCENVTVVQQAPLPGPITLLCSGFCQCA